MKNADQPKSGEDLIHSFSSTDYSEGYFKGLTKREYFSGLAVQGLLSSFTHNAANGFYGTEVVVSTAIEYADELLKQLEQ